jgi:hypothetical protein
LKMAMIATKAWIQEWHAPKETVASNKWKQCPFLEQWGDALGFRIVARTFIPTIGMDVVDFAWYQLSNYTNRTRRCVLASSYKLAKNKKQLATYH